MDQEKNILATRINQMRKELDLTQEELALKLGLKGKSSIANYESGKITPSDDIKLKMCKLFDCSMDYLMGKSEFKTKEEELDNYLSKEIKEDLTKKLKELALDKTDLEKAITAFIENYMVIADNPTVDIYNMQDSLIYYAYKLIAKYYFKLINKELSILTNNSNLLADKQAYFETAEEYAWNEMKKIIENIKEKEIISNLTIEKKVKRPISKSDENYKYYMCPIYNQILVEQPNWIEKNIIGRIPLDCHLYNIDNFEDCFYLKMQDNSLNKIIAKDTFILFKKQETAKAENIVLVIIDQKEPVVRKCVKLDKEIAIFQSLSDKGSNMDIIINKERSYKILGRMLGQTNVI